MGWFRLATHLHTPVCELKQRITSMEFVMWMEYLEQDLHSFHREDHLFANLQAEVRRSWVKNPRNVNPKHFLVKFNKFTPEQQLQRSKSFWLSSVGLEPVMGE